MGIDLFEVEWGDGIALFVDQPPLVAFAGTGGAVVEHTKMR